MVNTGSIDDLTQSGSLTNRGSLGNLHSTILGGDDGDNMHGDDFNTTSLTVGSGNDVMNGGAGSDYIVGCGGRDTLTGGADGDAFVYYKKSDSGPTAATRDTITDFVNGVDQLYLVTMDANDLIAGDQNFSLVANGGYGAFTGMAGQLRFQGSAAGTLVLGDTNGDKVADFSVLLQGVPLLTAGSVTL